MWAERHGADRQRGGGLGDRADQFDLAVELPALRVEVTLGPWVGPKHSLPRCAAVLVSWCQRGHLPPTAAIVGSPAHAPVRISMIASISSSTVPLGVGQRLAPMAAMTSWACPG